VPIERVLKTFGIKDADDLIERNHEFILEMSRPENGDLSEDQVEEAALKAEQQVTDSIYEAWKRSLDRVFDQVADDVGVRLLWRPTGDVTITSEVDWKTAAKKLRDVIHGVGMFAVDASEMRAPKRFVLDHWASASAYPDVYGGTSYARLFERDLEGNLRNL